MPACPPAWSTSSAAAAAVAGNALVEHPDVRAISFTGSSEVGSHVAQRAAATFKPVSLEMGGKNAQIVLDDANLELALDGALWGAFGTTGQRCTATSRILLQKGIAGEFTDEFVARAAPSKSAMASTSPSRSARRSTRARSKPQRSTSRSRSTEGGKLLCGGHALTNAAYAKGTFFEPTVVRRSHAHHAHCPRRSLRPGRRRDRVRHLRARPLRSPTPSTTAFRPRSTPRM